MAVLGVLTACSTEGARPPAFDACQPLALAAPAATADQLAGIEAAAALWRTVGVAQLDRPGAASLEIVFAQAAPASYGYYDGTAIYVADDLDAATRAIVLAHELGHALGLVHVAPAVRPSVMNPGNLGVEPSAADAAAVGAIWGDCRATP